MIDPMLVVFGLGLLMRASGRTRPTSPAVPPPSRQVPFPENARVVTPAPAPTARPPAPPPPTRGPIVLPEQLITPSPVPTAPAQKKKAVEVWRVRDSELHRSIPELQKLFPGAWRPAQPPTGAEVQKAVSLLGGWRKGGIHWDMSNNTPSGIRAYWYREH